VVGLGLAVWAGKFLPAWGWDQAFRWSGEGLAWAIICYGLAASVLPVWLLLAPRDYLSSFMKLGTVAVLGVAVVLIAPPLHMPALTKFIDGTGLIAAGPVFPFVCITIACGAVSGFHALVASGTTPKLVSRESVIRSVGYGAMITEMMVGLMALIAACALEPGQYFAINMSTKGTSPEAIVEKVNDAGFPVTVGGMEQLAADLHEPTMFGRAGGAPTFAVGMAKIFARVLGGPEAMSLWYHFAIMFEALFILTTIDAGTRVGRFILQDFLGNLWRPLGDTRSWWANVFTSALLVAAWGYFLLMGVRDPYGGINSLLPLFGIANQLLAVIGFSLGTTVIIKMGRARHAWVTLLPLVWLTTVTFRAAWLKVLSPDPRLGFLSAARLYQEKLAAGGEAAQLAEWRALVFNNQLNALMAALFVVLVAIILGGCLREWWYLLRGRKELVLREARYVRLEGA
jgi:carbon starvation protein